MGKNGIQTIPRLFPSLEGFLCDTIMMDVCHYTCVQIYRMCDTKSELGCKLWTLGDVDVSLYVHRLPLCAPLVGDGDTGKAERMRGQRVCEDSVLSAQFSMNLQLL